MADTPKSPGRRLLRKSALQASPFGAPVRSFHSNSSNNNSNNNSNNSNNTLALALSPSAKSIAPSSTTPSTTTASDAPDFSPFEAKEPPALASPPTDSPTRRSARLDSMQRNNIANNTNNNNTDTPSSLLSTPKKKKLARLHPPTTPNSKTIVPSFVWGEVLGLSRQDGSVYYRYPINKSYCSFGRSNLNDVRIQIEGVSENHCKLIRRDDGEVWLKDTSTNGTLLNDVLVHDTARPIQHHDIVTIGGRRFRFDTSEPIPRIPLQSTANSNTPGRQVRDIQATIDKDIQTLAEAPSPTPGRLLSTPKRSLGRSTAALESSLGLFTPNRAAKLSSLLVSPKPVPLPAFLTKSPRRPTTPKPAMAMIDEPSLFNTTSTTTPSFSSSSFTERQLSSDSGMHTPTKEKRKAPVDFDGVLRTPKKVSFGPALSPEIFDKSNPPSTPIKRGQQQDPDTPRRQGLSTPSLLSKLSAAGSASKPILTPSRLSRTFLLADLQRPAPPNLFAPENQQDAEEDSKTDQQESKPQAEALESTQGNDSISLDNNNSAPDLRSEGNSLWKQRIISTNSDADEMALNNLAGFMDMSSEDGEQSPRPLGSLLDEDDDDNNSPPTTPTRAPSGPSSTRGVSGYGRLVDGFDDDDEDDESPPATPTRGPSGRVCNTLTSTSTRPKPLSPFLFQQKLSRSLEKKATSPIKSDDEDLFITAQERNKRTPSPTLYHSNLAYSEKDMFDDNSSGSAAIHLQLSSPTRSTIAADTTPVHTPIRRQTAKSNPDHDNTTSTPGSASRIALLQLSASKVRCLPDLLQSPAVSNSNSDSAGLAPGTTSAVKLTLPVMDFSDDEVDDDDDMNHRAENASTPRIDEMRADAKAETEAQDEDESLAQVHDAPVLEEGESSDEICQDSTLATINLSETENQMPLSTDAHQGRRSSAPAAAMRDSSESPFFTGLRGVFRTPQKVVESCLSGFVGFRNYVMSPSKPPGLPLLLGADETTGEDLGESAVEILGVQENVDGALPSTTDTYALSTSGSKTNSWPPAQSLEQIRVGGRRSETLPQKRSVASPYRSQERVAKEKEEKEARRRTFSLFEYHKEDFKVPAPGLTAETEEATESERAVASAASDKGQLSTEDQEDQAEQQIDGEEDAEHKELLRILGEGFSPVDENEDDSQHDSIAYEHEMGDQLDFDAPEQEDVLQEEKRDSTVVLSPRRASSRRSSYGSRVSTPIKRRHSFKQRLGSSSPAFRLYEQDQDDDDEEEDVVSMISPKRVRTTNLLG